MNDGNYKKISDETITHYRDTAQSMIDKMKAGGVRTIIIGSPGCVGDVAWGHATSTPREYNQTLAVLRDIDKEVAEKNHVLFADVFTPMTDVTAKARAKYGNTYQLSGPDGVHPSPNGHLVMAYAFLKAMGFNGDIGTITVDLSTNTASATPGHKILTDSIKNGSVEIESTRYPFCFAGKPESFDSTTGVIEFFPFNQDLNRLTLVVKNAPAEKMKITWGSTSKEFAAADLAAGINLAAEFLDNPFSQQFQKVHDAVTAQQAFETPFVRTFIANFPAYKDIFSDEDQQTLNHLADDGAKKDKDLFDTAAALVSPVHHTIRIEVVK